MPSFISWENYPELTPPPKDPKATRLVIYAVNDVYEFEYLSGCKRFIELHSQISQADKSIRVLSGDFLSPSTLALFDYGKTMTKALNDINIDYVCLGNHEFDIPNEQLILRFSELNAKIINSNLASAIPEMDAIIGKTVQNEYITLQNGATVALLGYLTEETEQMMRIVAKGDIPVKMTNIDMQAYEDCYKIRDSRKSSSTIINTSETKDTLEHADAIVLLTHQFVPNDLATIKKIAAGVSKNNCPINVVLGGHEHDPFLFVQNQVPLVKAGSDMAFCGVVYMDFIISSDEEVNHHMEIEEKANDKDDDLSISFMETFYEKDKAVTPTYTLRHISSQYSVSTTTQLASIKLLLESANEHGILEPYEILTQYRQEGLDIIKTFGNEILYKFPLDQGIISSRDVRTGPNKIGKFLCDIIKASTNVDLVILPSGKIRGNKNYTDETVDNPGAFTFVDALAELPFSDNEYAIVKCSGLEIYKMLSYSTSYHMSRGGYLQTDSNVILQSGKVISINGKPFLNDSIYSLGAPLTQLQGMDNNPMLIHIGKKNTVDKLSSDDLPLLQHLVIQYLRNKQKEGSKSEIIEGMEE